MITEMIPPVLQTFEHCTFNENPTKTGNNFSLSHEENCLGINYSKTTRYIPKEIIVTCLRLFRPLWSDVLFSILSYDVLDSFFSTIRTCP